MELSSTKLGPFHLYTIETGRFMLDGGAMFGVVPKTLWSRQIEADEKNRIPMAMRCLLITSEQTGKTYLIDNGCGTKFDEKFESIYGLDHTHSNLEDSLAYHGFKPEDITDIIFTHLHFDHCGGTTYYDDTGSLAHTFPNASYHVTKKHWETATHPNAREKASFLPENIDPIGKSSLLHLVDDNFEYEPGLSAIAVQGHTLSQQLPKIEAEGRTIIFAADLLPTHVHVPLPWVMGYDMRPIETLKEKEEFLNNAVSHNWYIYLEHDASRELISLENQDGKYKVADMLTLDDI